MSPNSPAPHAPRWCPAPVLAYFASALILGTSALQVALTYILQSRWRRVRTLPFLSDATYDTTQAPLFVATTAVSASALLAAAAAAAAVQPSRPAAATGGVVVALGAAAAVAASAVHASSPAHWPLAFVAFGALALRLSHVAACEGDRSL